MFFAGFFSCVNKSKKNTSIIRFDIEYKKENLQYISRHGSNYELNGQIFDNFNHFFQNCLGSFLLKFPSSKVNIIIFCLFVILFLPHNNVLILSVREHIERCCIKA